MLFFKLNEGKSEIHTELPDTRHVQSPLSLKCCVIGSFLSSEGVQFKNSRAPQPSSGGNQTEFPQRRVRETHSLKDARTIQKCVFIRFLFIFLPCFFSDGWRKTPKKFCSRCTSAWSGRVKSSPSSTSTSRTLKVFIHMKASCFRLLPSRHSHSSLRGVIDLKSLKKICVSSYWSDQPKGDHARLGQRDRGAPLQCNW